MRHEIGSPGRTGALSTHFTAAELACPHCHACIVSPHLVELLEELRRRIGGPLSIVSGYRCPVHNHDVGGADDSQHMYGRAADIPLGLFSINAASAAGAVGIGYQGGWVRHVDVREGPKAIWRYPS